MNKITHRYQGGAGREYHQGKRSIPPEAFPWVAESRAQKIRPHVGPNDVILEYGAGYGWNLAALKCARRIGQDLSDFLAEDLARHGIEFVTDTRRLENGLAHVVLCHHTLEHVPDPVAVLAEIRRLARPDAKILLFVPFEKERRYRRFNPREPNHHLFSWNVQTLGNLVESCGFTVQQAGLGRFGYDRFAAKQAVRLRLGEPGFRTLRALAHLIFPACEVRLVARPDGD